MGLALTVGEVISVGEGDGVAVRLGVGLGVSDGVGEGMLVCSATEAEVAAGLDMGAALPQAVRRMTSEIARAAHLTGSTTLLLKPFSVPSSPVSAEGMTGL